MMLFSALVCFAIATLVGMWRNYCIYLDRQSMGMCPLLWHRPAVPFLSFLFVAVTSIWSSVIFAELTGSIVFGVSLALRWVISSQWAIAKAKREVARVAKKMTEQDVCVKETAMKEVTADDLIRRIQERKRVPTN